MKNGIKLLLVTLVIPLSLGVCAMQTIRYNGLKKEVMAVRDSQLEWVDSNKKLIAEISRLASPRVIENIAQTNLRLQKIRPDNVLHITITGGGKGHGY